MYKRKATEEKYNHEELVAVYKGEVIILIKYCNNININYNGRSNYYN